jgi:hypothetical protein
MKQQNAQVHAQVTVVELVLFWPLMAVEIIIEAETYVHLLVASELMVKFLSMAIDL